MKKYLPLLIVFVSLKSMAQLPSFPTAEGAGGFTTGGRGTVTVPSTVFAVTTLIDDNNVNTVGSIRWALNKSATYRTVIFRVSGTIHLIAPLKISKSNTTIAGQTSPGEGICFADYPVSVSANNVIVRYIRFRMGDKNQNLGMVNLSGNDDSFGGLDISNLIIDHCTMSWSDDEACSFYRGSNFTLQWNMISEPLNYSYHFETGDADFEHHGYGGIEGGAKVTIHHNLYAHCQGRAPRFDGSRNLGDGLTPGLENVDFRNNVIYNWGAYNSDGGEGGNYNIVNNYYKSGPSTSTSSASGVKIKSEIIYPFKNAQLPWGKYYLSGNFVKNYPATTANNWLGAAMAGGTRADTVSSKVTTPFSLPNINTQTAIDAYGAVLNSVGCSLPNRDTLDQRIIKNVIDSTGKIIDVQGGFPAHSTNTPAGFAATLGAWPTLYSQAAPTTTNTYNIPDEWLAQRGLTGAALSGAGGYHSNGYTHLEIFLNGDSIVAVGTVNNCVTAKPIVANNTGNWVDAKDSLYGYYKSPKYLVSTDTNNVVASILDNQSANNYGVSYYTTNTIRYDASSRAYLNRNILITPSNAVGSSNTVRFYFTAAEYAALKAADLAINSLADLVVLKVENNTCLNTLGSVYTIIEPSATASYGTYKNGYYIEFSTNSFSNFFIGSRAAFTTPLKLINFSAVVDASQKANLNWATQNELNVKKYITERSIDGVNFEAIGEQNALNNSTNNYHFIDANPLIGTSYYRLKMIDNNGVFTYSKIETVYIKAMNQLSFYPNPVKNILQISLPKNNLLTTLKVLAVDGKKIIQQSTIANGTIKTMNVSSLPKGLYILQMINANKIENAKFVKQ